MSPPPSATRRGSNNNSSTTSNSNGTSEDYNIELGSQEQVLPDATGSTIAGTTNGTTIDTGKAPLFLLLFQGMTSFHLIYYLAIYDCSL